VGVAIVPSLNGQSIDEYSQGLFRAWGVGRYGENNGALFVWAPNERQIRIHVGSGLEAVLTNSQAALIIRRVRDLFRAGRYEDGVNAAVDGIIEVIGPGTTTSTPPPSEPQPTPAPASESQEQAGGISIGIAFLVAIALGVGLWLVVRQRRQVRWTEELQRVKSEGDAAVTEAQQKHETAEKALTDLRNEAPADVWQRCETTLREAPGSIERQRRSLSDLRLLPSESYGELKAEHHAWLRWEMDMLSTHQSLDDVRKTLDTFRTRRDASRDMLTHLPPRLVRMEAGGVPDSAEGLLRAAADTLEQARQESQSRPANWLLVYDLLADVDACLDQIENPRRARYRPVRYWDGDIESPAQVAMEAMYISQMQASGGGSWDSGSSGGGFDSGSSGGGGGGFDSGGSFGGGDSGGGGASSDY
jgi:uncharacterized membrane protein YgcG